MILLKKFGVDIGPILAGAGIIGLAVGFGAQELVRDFISGFFILLENQIRVGDVAIINGTGGLVEKIELRTTTLRDFSGTTHIFQNGKINTISNMTKEWSAVVFDIGVAYKEDTDQVTEIMKQVGNELANDPDFKDLIINPLEIFGVDKFADSAVIIKARLKTKPLQQWGVGREYRRRLKKAFDKNDIEIPFPHTTVYWGEKINPLKLDIENQLKGN
jgi:small conductance mechanosensitive channel